MRIAAGLFPEGITETIDIPSVLYTGPGADAALIAWAQAVFNGSDHFSDIEVAYTGRNFRLTNYDGVDFAILDDSSNIDLFGLAPTVSSVVYYPDAQLIADVALPTTGQLIADVTLDIFMENESTLDTYEDSVTIDAVETSDNTTLADLAADMSVCEFGCGIGVFLPTLAPEAEKVYAVDIFPQYARETARIFDLDVAFSKDLDGVPDNSLDLVIACEVMEHLADPGAYARLFAQKLKTGGGRLIMSGPTETWIYKLGRILAGYHKYHDYHPHNVFQLHEIITQNGFKPICQTPYPWKILPLYKINVYYVNH